MTAPEFICEQAGGVITPGNPCLLSPEAAATGFGDWKYLINHRPYDAQNEIRRRFPSKPAPGYHAIEDAIGPTCNLDFYPIQILEWPKPNNVWPAMDKTQMTTAQMVYRLRADINNFVDSTYAAHFDPYDNALDRPRWSSRVPSEVLGAVITIKMLMFTKIGPYAADHGSVVTSECAEDHWIFSTLPTTEDWGHPVSGNRQFGISTLRAGDSLSNAYSKTADGSNASPGVSFQDTGQDIPYVYIRGADRPTNAVDAANSSIIFKSSDALWRGFQERMARWINTSGGKAYIPGSVWMQLDWDRDIKARGLWRNPQR